MGTLRFAPHLTVAPVPGEAVYLVSERGVTALHGGYAAALAPLLDGTRDLARVLADAAHAVPAEEGARIVDRLRAAGLVYESDGEPGPREAYWSLACGAATAVSTESAGSAKSTGTAHRTAAVTPAGRPAAVAVLGSTDPSDAHRALRAAGLRPVPEPAAAALTVVVCDDYLDPALAGVDAEHRAAGRGWLPVKPVGTTIWIGPFLGDPDGPCWSCLAERLWRGRRAEAHLLGRLGRPGPVPRPPAALTASRSTALQLAALQAAGWLAGHRHPAQSALWTLDCLTGAGERHPVQRRPQCPACGDPSLVADRVRAPFALPSEPSAGAAPSAEPPAGPVGAVPSAEPPAGPIGAVPSAEPSARRLLDTYAHLIDPLTGLVSEIRRDPRGPAFLNCFHARYRPAPEPPGPLGPLGPAARPGLDRVRAGLRAAAHGKGATSVQARASALGEALEHHSGRFAGDEPRRRARLRDLEPGSAVHPDLVQLYAERQFADRARWNAAHAPQHQVCDPFDPDAEIDWTPVWSVTAGRHRLMPTALLYYDAPQPPGRRYCLATSNGAAAGGDPADAVVRGFLELVERDAVALWWYNRTRQPGLDLDAFESSGDTWLGRLRQVHAELHREVWALDLTTDLGIPVVAALSRRTDKAAEDVTLGFGAHFDRRTALRRALAELNQMLPPVVHACADGSGYDTADPDALRWFRTASVAGQPYLAPDPAGVPPREPGADGTAYGTDSGGLGAVRDIVRAHGLELLVLDQTRPDVGLPVVRVCVPGLRPHWARFAPGRLFDVPVSLGRVAAPTAYESLNPVPLFM
ncbi:TOMM precursor leader peptide-binding protein [Streptomyces sp. P1-3]|uniref:TOMM precursor leader peptide-binding protein n=1 Tax=Streptomyces sp. P1-3 TaxID=3421658 RepID=UPI003D35D357